MARSSTPETSQLGALQAEYKANRLTTRILLGAGIISVLLSLLLFSIALGKARSQSTVLSDSFRKDAIFINASLGLFMLLLAVFFFVYHRYHTSLRVAVYADGFVSSDWRKSLACRWDEAVEVRESITRVYHRTTDTIRPGPRRWEYVVYRADGQRIKIAGLEGIVQLGQTLKTEISKHSPQSPPARPAGTREMRNRRIKVIAAAAVLLAGGLIFGAYAVARQATSQSRHETKRALEGVCVGDGASVSEAAAYAQASGLHPVMYVEKSGLGNWISSHNYRPPAGWRSEEPVDTELVACLEEEQVEIERCPYTLQNGDSAVLVRLQWQTVVTLREARTGRVVAASETIPGEPPRACQESEQFTEGDLTEFISGERPEGGVEAWLEPYVEIP